MSAKFYGDINLVKKILDKHDILSLKYSRSGTKVFVGSASGMVKSYLTGSLQLESKVGEEPRDSSIERIPVTCVDIFPTKKEHDKYVIASYTNGSICLWNMDSKKLKGRIIEDQQVLGVYCHPHSNKFLTAGDDAIIRVYDLEKFTLIQSHRSSNIMGKNDGHTSRIFSLDFHPLNGTEFISAGWDNTIQIWDIRTLQSQRFIAGPHVCGDSVRIRPNGKEILSCAYTKESPLQIFEYSTGKLVSNLNVDPFNTAMCYCAKWFNDEIFTVGCTEPSLFRVVNMGEQSSIAYYRSPVTAVYSADVQPITYIEVRDVKGTKDVTSTHDDNTDLEKAMNTRKTGRLSKFDTNSIEKEMPILRAVFCNGRILLEVDVMLPREEK